MEKFLLANDGQSVVPYLTNGLMASRLGMGEALVPGMSFGHPVGLSAHFFAPPMCKCILYAIVNNGLRSPYGERKASLLAPASEDYRTTALLTYFGEFSTHAEVSL